VTAVNPAGVLLASRVRLGFVPVEGSTVRQCDHCGADVWLAPESVDLAGVVDVAVWCWQCAVILLETGALRLAI
jgi:hypothetical protein